MHSSIVPSTPPPAPEPVFTFPGIFRNRHTGSIWIASSPNQAHRLFVGKPNGLDGREVGDHPDKWPDVSIEPKWFERVTSDITITFHLP